MRCRGGSCQQGREPCTDGCAESHPEDSSDRLLDRFLIAITLTLTAFIIVAGLAIWLS